ncbi:MAG: sodium-dependent transporter [Bacteroidales bacterium]|jgi:NSS family neurotransmitter:Na+ symporter|nr:sodium-dependent transporter [Bacteroidales bacterium]
MAEEKKNRDGFGSKIGIIAAAAGSAIGLGNIYRFPCELGNNGGAAFLLVYLAVVIFLGIPVMLSELVIGRRSQSNAVGAFKKLAPKSGWPIVGYMGVLCGFIIFAFYSTVSGWTLEYIIKAVTNSFQGKDLAAMEQDFTDFHNMGWRNVMWQAIFIFLTGFVVFKGVQNGIERYAKILMPLLLVILIVLGIRSVTLPGAKEGLSFLFRPDFSKIDGNVLISALGQGFFSLSLGMGALITYGSYIKKKDNLTSTAFSVVLADTLIALLAGLVIFPAAFSFGIRPTAGMGLVFNTIPMIFNQMTGGYIFCIIFFVLLAIAALTSTISLLEVVVAYLSEELHINRKWSTVLASAATLFIGSFASLSLMENTPFVIGGRTVFDLMDFVSSNILLPLGGVLIVIFVGWRLGKAKFFEEVTNEGTIKASLKKVIFFIIRYLAPIAITIVFIRGLIK